MGTEWYLARRDTKELLALGKRGFWFAEKNGLSDDNPTPSISADWYGVASVIWQHYKDFDEQRWCEAAYRIIDFIGPGAVVVDEHELTLEDFDDDTWEWRGDVYKLVGDIHRVEPKP